MKHIILSPCTTNYNPLIEMKSLASFNNFDLFLLKLEHAIQEAMWHLSSLESNYNNTFIFVQYTVLIIENRIKLILNLLTKKDLESSLQLWIINNITKIPQSNELGCWGTFLPRIIEKLAKLKLPGFLLIWFSKIKSRLRSCICTKIL